MKKKLVWNVYVEDFNAHKIKTFNVLSSSMILDKLEKLRKEYKKGLKLISSGQDYVFKHWRKNVEFNKKTLRKTSFDVKFRDEVLAEQLKSELMYYFWSKSECEIILTSWPPYLTSAQVEEIRNSKEVPKYCKSVNLETAEKIDIYDQIINNWEPFILYIWTYFLEADFKRIK